VASADITLVDALNLRHLIPEAALDAQRQGNHPVFVSFAFADDQLFACKVHIFNAETAAHRGCGISLRGENLAIIICEDTGS
jgi:hypothetical protein